MGKNSVPAAVAPPTSDTSFKITLPSRKKSDSEAPACINLEEDSPEKDKEKAAVGAAANNSSSNTANKEVSNVIVLEKISASSDAKSDDDDDDDAPSPPPDLSSLVDGDNDFGGGSPADWMKEGEVHEYELKIS